LEATLNKLASMGYQSIVIIRQASGATVTCEHRRELGLYKSLLIIFTWHFFRYMHLLMIKMVTDPLPGFVGRMGHQG